MMKEMSIFLQLLFEISNINSGVGTTNIIDELNMDFNFKLFDGDH